MHIRLPKVGFRSKIKGDTAQVMLYQLDKLEGDIDFAALRAAKLVPASAKQAKIVKKGEISKKLVLKGLRSEEHTSELQSLMRISYAVFCLKKKTYKHTATYNNT